MHIYIDTYIHTYIHTYNMANAHEKFGAAETRQTQGRKKGQKEGCVCVLLLGALVLGFLVVVVQISSAAYDCHSAHWDW